MGVSIEKPCCSRCRGRRWTHFDLSAPLVRHHFRRSEVYVRSTVERAVVEESWYFHSGTAAVCTAIRTRGRRDPPCSNTNEKKRKECLRLGGRGLVIFSAVCRRSSLLHSHGLSLMFYATRDAFKTATPGAYYLSLSSSYRCDLSSVHPILGLPDTETGATRPTPWGPHPERAPDVPLAAGVFVASPSHTPRRSSIAPSSRPATIPAPLVVATHLGRRIVRSSTPLRQRRASGQRRAAAALAMRACDRVCRARLWASNWASPVMHQSAEAVARPGPCDPRRRRPRIACAPNAKSAAPIPPAGRTGNSDTRFPVA